MKKKNKKISTMSKKKCIFASQLLWIIMKLQKQKNFADTLLREGYKVFIFNILEPKK